MGSDLPKATWLGDSRTGLDPGPIPILGQTVLAVEGLHHQGVGEAGAGLLGPLGPRPSSSAPSSSAPSPPRRSPRSSSFSLKCRRSLRARRSRGRPRRSHLRELRPPKRRRKTGPQARRTPRWVAWSGGGFRIWLCRGTATGSSGSWGGRVGRGDSPSKSRSQPPCITDLLPEWPCGAVVDTDPRPRGCLDLHTRSLPISGRVTGGGGGGRARSFPHL